VKLGFLSEAAPIELTNEIACSSKEPFRNSGQTRSTEALQNVLESGIDEVVRTFVSSWEEAYKTVPPWDVGRPQPAFVELVRAGELGKGRVLDVGCGTGENALYLAGNGFSVVGVDLSDRAIAAARAKAAERRLKVDFRTGNALSLEFKDNAFDNVIDSGLFHTFPDNDRPVYTHEMARVLATRGRYFMLCFSEKEPTNWGGPRRIRKEEIETTFSPLFKINYIKDASFATRFHSNGGKAYLTSATKISV
jgi:ubiquinone/menaquinone biosynthesis C-methylase UbiE